MQVLKLDIDTVHDITNIAGFIFQFYNLQDFFSDGERLMMKAPDSQFLSSLYLKNYFDLRSFHAVVS